MIRGQAKSTVHTARNNTYIYLLVNILICEWINLLTNMQTALYIVHESLSLTFFKDWRGLHLTIITDIITDIITEIITDSECSLQSSQTAL